MHVSKIFDLFFIPCCFVTCILFLDINECSSQPCHPNATCTDNEGSFDCECNVGYNGTGFNCSSKYIFSFVHICLKYLTFFSSLVVCYLYSLFRH